MDYVEENEGSPRPIGRRGQRQGGDSRRQRLIDLGIDEEIIDNDPDLAEVLAASLIEERENEAQRKLE